MNLDLLLKQIYNLKKDCNYWENKGYIISDFVKSMIDNIIKYLELQKKREKIYKSFLELQIVTGK